MTPCARIAVALLAFTLPVIAQAKPNFSGRWVVVSPQEGAGREQIITQTEKTLTTERAAGDARKRVYQLDGVERRLALPSQAGDVTVLARARWDAGRIVITTDTSYSGGMRTRATDTW